MADPWVPSSLKLVRYRWPSILASLARIIVYSMANDGDTIPPSNAPTPMFSPLPSGISTPHIQDTPLVDYLSLPLGKKVQPKTKSYLAGCKALDSLARMIASTESFFHPSNSGSWTADVGNFSPRTICVWTTNPQLSAFIKYIVYDFNKRDSTFSSWNLH